MFSETKTGINFFPLCTAKVNPTISGLTSDRLDHVLITFLEPLSLAFIDLLQKMVINERPFFY